MRTNFPFCERCGADTLDKLLTTCTRNAPAPTRCAWCEADTKSHAYLCLACQAHADAALRIAQAGYAKRPSFKRLDD